MNCLPVQPQPGSLFINPLYCQPALFRPQKPFLTSLYSLFQFCLISLDGHLPHQLQVGGYLSGLSHLGGLQLHQLHPGTHLFHCGDLRSCLIC